MKVAILAGGLGSRLSEETDRKPKPLVEIGGRPILWHIMMQYSHYGFREFVIALGYRGESVKRYLMDYPLMAGNLSLCYRSGHIDAAEGGVPDWKIELIDTGAETLTGGRIKRLAPYLGNETFMLTWCDGVSDLDIQDLLRFHRSHGRLATMTVVHPPPRFGRPLMIDDRVIAFSEKPVESEEWINGAFFVLEPGIFEYIEGDGTQWEHEPLQRMAREGQLMAYRYPGFWQCMDTMHDKTTLESLWNANNAPWKVWR